MGLKNYRAVCGPGGCDFVSVAQPVLIAADRCGSCGHVQLRTETDPQDRYATGYSYTMGDIDMELRRITPAFTDVRGAISDILVKTPIDHVGLLESKRGAIRGNHYHAQTTQYLYVVKGSLTYFSAMEVEQGRMGAPTQTYLQAGDLAISPPFEAHAMHFLEPSLCLILSAGPRGGEDYEKDTFRVPSLVVPRCL